MEFFELTEKFRLDTYAAYRKKVGDMLPADVDFPDSDEGLASRFEEVFRGFLSAFSRSDKEAEDFMEKDAEECVEVYLEELKALE